MLTADGARLVTQGPQHANQYLPDRTTRVFELATQHEIHAWPAEASFADSSLARGGSMVGRYAAASCTVTDVTGASVFYSGACGAVPLPAPSGAAFALPMGNRSSPGVTRFYSGGQLVDAVNGVGAGWVDDGHLLVNEYSAPNVFTRTVIYDAAANFLGALAIPEPRGFSPATARGTSTTWPGP
jgi:hypothetical protein